MRAVDTNVLVRLITRDHPKQVTAAESFVARGAWVSHLVLAETLWVLESVYEQAVAVEFALRGIAFVRQKPIPLFYRDHQIGEHRLDFLVEGKIVVELKAIDGLENVHFAIVRSYLKASGLADGLILNFSSMPLTVKRVRRERTFEVPDLQQ